MKRINWLRSRRPSAEAVFQTTGSLAAVALMLVLTTGLILIPGQVAHAQLIAYEGFDYPIPDGGNADLGTVGAGDLGGGIGWAPDDQGTGLGVYGWVDHDGLTQGASMVQDPTNWIDNGNDASLADWGYTDSQGNSLQTSGYAFSQRNWNKVKRNIDFTDVDPSLLRGSVRSPGYDAFGAGGATLWISFLGEGMWNAANGNMANVELTDGSMAVGWGPVSRVAIGRPWTLQADGTQGSGNDAWGIMDLQPDVDPFAATGNVANDRVFFVTRIDFYDAGDTLPDGSTSGFGDEIANIWINPDLGATAPAEEDAAISDFELFDFALMGMWFTGNSDTYFDEVRFGLTYADVAPIAAAPGLDGDFDGDGDVDGADFLKWQRDSADAGELTLWKSNFGATSPPAAAVVAVVPEPSSIVLVVSLAAGAAGVRRRRRSVA